MARTRPRRKTIARNIYQRGPRFEIAVMRGGQRAWLRFPLTTPLEKLREARDALEDDLDFEAGKPVTGTLGADVATALATVPSPTRRRDLTTLLGHWLRAPHGETTLGDLPRAALTPLIIRTQLATFGAMTHPDGTPRFAPKTVRELRRLLAWVYTTIDGPDAKNPVRAVKGPRVRYDDPRGIDYDVIEWIFAHAPDRGRPQDGPAGGHRGETARPTVSLSKLRAAVMAYTGLHQVELARVASAHIDLKRRRLWIEPRVKGTGAPGAWHRLTARGAAALEALVAAQGLGPFDPRSLARSWRVWLRLAKAAWDGDRSKGPWPVRADARPYDLRHSFGTKVFLETGDIRTAQAMLRHRQLSTASRYTLAAVAPRVEAAVAKLDGAWTTNAPTTPAPPVSPRPDLSRSTAAAPATPRGRGRGKSRNLAGK